MAKFTYPIYKEYIRCPKCGDLAELDPEILTSFPPQRMWHCSHCGDVGSDYCHNLEIITVENTVEIDDGTIVDKPDDLLTLPTVHELEKYFTIENAIALGNVKSYCTCELCGKEFEVGDANYSGPIKPFCPNCLEKLRKLIGIKLND